jgi:O-antigen/teichoic acid export membrane protein
MYAAAPLLVRNWIHLSTIHPLVAVHALRWLGAAVLTALPRALYGGVIRGMERMEINNGIDVLANAALQCGLIAIIQRGGGLPQVATWFLVCLGLWTAGYMVACARLVSWRALMTGFSWPVVPKNAPFAGGMMSIAILEMIHNQADKLLVSKLLPIGVFGYYGFASGAIARVTALTGAIAQAAFPSLAAGLPSADRATMISQYRKLQDFVCVLIAPVLAGLSFAATPALAYAFDRATARSMLLPAVWLCAGYYLNAAWKIPYTFSIAAGMPGIAVKSNSLALIVVLPVTVVLVVCFGASGAGFSWVVYNIFSSAYVVPRVLPACLDIPSRPWFFQVGRFTLMAGAAYLPAWLVADRLAGGSLAALAAAYVAGSVLFLAGSYIVSGAELREVLFRGLRARPGTARVLPVHLPLRSGQ